MDSILNEVRTLFNRGNFREGSELLQKHKNLLRQSNDPTALVRFLLEKAMLEYDGDDCLPALSSASEALRLAEGHGLTEHARDARALIDSIRADLWPSRTDK